MRSQLAIEWMKVKKYRTFWVLTGLFMLVLPLWNYQISKGVIEMGGSAAGQGVNFFKSAYSFPEVWGNVGFWAGMFITFLSILMIILTTNEFSFRTNRQNVMDGWSRLQFFHAKIAVVVVLSLLAAVYVFLVGLLLGVSNSRSVGNMFDGISKVGYFFLLALNYLGFALLVAILIRRSGLAIGLFVLYAYVAENMLKGLFSFFTNSHMGEYLPLQSSDELLPFQLLKMLRQMVSPTVEPAVTTYVVASVCWCAVYYFAGRAILMRRDW